MRIFEYEVFIFFFVKVRFFFCLLLLILLIVVDLLDEIYNLGILELYWCCIEIEWIWNLGKDE